MKTEFQRAIIWHQASGKATSHSAWFRFPIRLFSAARSETISFNLLHKEDHSRIKQVTYCQAEDKPVPRSEMVKGYEYEKDHYVVIDDEDIKKVAPKTAQGDGDPGVREGRPGGPDLPGELLLRGARRRRREAVRAAVPGAAANPSYYARGQGRDAQSRAHHRAASRATRAFCSHTMYYQDEIRQVEEFRTDTSLVKDKELAMAKMLISSLEAEFEPQKYHDKYRENLQQDDRGQDRRQEGGGDAEPSTSRR